MNTMSYKGYAARIEYSDEDDCFVGHIAGINDIVGFHGDSVSELHAAFEEAIVIEGASFRGRADGNSLNKKDKKLGIEKE